MNKESAKRKVVNIILAFRRVMVYGVGLLAVWSESDD